ncbi:MAG TPA: Ig-like domain-containing protein [Solirubrobacterales bacterium]|nr:Ig-like domain-containing protein [Solirubrobacterales bacterium]
MALGLVLSVSAPAAPPALTADATDAVIGGAIHATAELSESPGASGEISFEVFASDDCAGPALDQSSVTVSGEGEYTSEDFEPSAAGNYYWSAFYSGDGVNEPAESICSATSTVAKASPGMTGSAGSGPVGTAIHDEVTLTGGFSPGGEVSFSVYAPGDAACTTPLETTSAPIAGGKATSGDFLPQQAGEFRWTAEYEGDADNEAVSLDCNAADQTSTVAKASPSLLATATSTVVTGNAITDEAVLSGGFSPGGQVVFRAYGPDDATCGGTPAYEAAVPVSGNGSYAPAGFAPGPGVYRWTAQYEGDGNNEAVGLGCNASGQASAVGTIDVTLTASAGGGTVGTPVTATATLREGAVPGGQIIFRAFPPGDAGCSGAAAFTSSVAVAGNGTYGSAPFVPDRVGTFRWTVTYTGDANHAPAAVGCGGATSAVSRAKPAISGAAPQRIAVGNAFSDAVTLQGGFAPNGTVTFRIYGPVAGGCAGAAFVNTVAVTGNGTVNSDLFVPQRPGRYSFAASYSGDAENQPASEPCDSPRQVVKVVKRSPRVRPRAVLVGRQISIRAHLSRAFAPTASITFRLYGPGDPRCRRKPKFSGAVTVKANGTFPLARYLATKRGVYRLSVGYSGDQRNRRFAGSCSAAQAIRVK